MSATGRSPRLGGADDDYETPEWCVDRFLQRCSLPEGMWLEPAAGNGAIVRAASRHGKATAWCMVEIKHPLDGFALVQLRRQFKDTLIFGNFLKVQKGPDLLPEKVDCVIMNPPYSLAEEFVLRCRDLYPEASINALLRLNFLASQRRAKWLKSWVPDVYVLPKRPSFKNGKTDATEYAWFHWPWKGERTAGKVFILDV